MNFALFPANQPGAIPNELFNSAAVPEIVSDPSSVGLFPPSTIPYLQQPSYNPYYTDSIDLRSSLYSPFGVLQSADPAAIKFAEGLNSGVVVSTENIVPVTKAPLAKTAEKVESGEKKVTVESVSSGVTEAPKKINTVQIIQDDPFNGQFPQL